MPLKHHSETVFLLVLGLVMCAYGALLALLPHVPEGVLPWLVLFTIAVLYPVVLRTHFRLNRADYEFRFLHWFPAGMALVWLLIEFCAQRIVLARVLQLGITALWSMPLVLVGLLMIVAFSLHVIRRRLTRIIGICVLFFAFVVAAFVAHSGGYNPVLAKMLYPNSEIANVAADFYRSLTFNALVPFPPSADHSSQQMQSAMSADIVSFVQSSHRLFASIAPFPSADRAFGPMRPSVHSPAPRLPRTGNDALAFLILTCLAFYCGVLHVRAHARATLQ